MIFNWNLGTLDTIIIESIPLYLKMYSLMLSYNIIKPIAKGGQKSVSLAVLEDGTKVVVKVAPIVSTAGLQRMVRECSLLRKLDNPYFPKNYDAGLDIGTMSLTTVEEYIEGETLMARSKDFSDKCSIKRLLLQIVDGLEVVWKMNIVHRDLKPANIIIRPDCSPCIIDFGIARFLDMESLTDTLSPIGPNTPLYASPEQMNNSKHLIDMRTDFYALGIIALELYLGIHPFDPSVVPDSELTILDNMRKGKYATFSAKVAEDNEITNLANRLLKQQPYMRPRDYYQLRQIINTL